MRLRARSISRIVVAAAGLIAITACYAPPVATPPNHVEQETPLRIAGNKVDVLFLIDNSSSMKPMQDELNKRFGDFLQVFEQLAHDGFYTDLHIGVVTSDFGAGSVDAKNGCVPSPGGDHGYLQAIGKSPAPGCKAPNDSPFIHYAYVAGGDDMHNLPAGQGLPQTFTCMASVGAGGCGFEHQLEAVYAALHENYQQNAGFLRPDALLAVVFVTNEDDGSADPQSDIYNPNSDPGFRAKYGPYDTYRQAHYGIACGNPLSVLPLSDSGELTDCVPANSNVPLVQLGLEYPIDRYVSFFKQPASKGGVKSNPADVLLFAIDGPSAPVSVVTIKPSSPLTVYDLCKSGDTGCVARVQHSCINKAQNDFFADPAVRLNAVLHEVDPSSVTESICGEDPTLPPDYTHALNRLGVKLRERLSGCIAVPLADGNPENLCTVTQDQPDGKGGVISTVVPSCSSGNFPCWNIAAAPLDRCHGIADGLALSVERNGVSAPSGATLRAACSTKVQ
jgi:hypothetical protein